MAKLLRENREFPVSDIHIGERLREMCDDGAAAIANSMQELGYQKDPIDLRWHKRRKRRKRYELIDGRHRIGAITLLKMTSIWVKVWECTDTEAELMEIDSQIGRSDLTALDQAVFLAKRKALFDKLHPELAKGGFRGNQHTGKVVPDMMSFATATARKFGVTEKHVRRLVAAGAALGDDAKRLRAAPKAVTLQDLMQISKIADATERDAVVGALEAGTAKKASEAWATVKAANGQGKAPKSPADAGHMRMVDNWKRAPKAAKVRYLEDCGEEIIALLKEMGDL